MASGWLVRSPSLILSSISLEVMTVGSWRRWEMSSTSRNHGSATVPRRNQSRAMRAVNGRMRAGTEGTASEGQDCRGFKGRLRPAQIHDGAVHSAFRLRRRCNSRHRDDGLWGARSRRVRSPERGSSRGEDLFPGRGAFATSAPAVPITAKPILTPKINDH